MVRSLSTRLMALLLFLAAPAVMGLSTDKDQPASVEADEVEYDFKTGVRTYKGNVVVVQGSIRITGDKLVVKYEENELKSATAWGNLASFRQRPDGKDQDVIGKGKQIVYEQVKNSVTLIDTASLQQGADVANGDLIVYDMEQDKLKVKSLTSSEGTGTAKQEPAAAGAEGAKTTATATEEGTAPATKPGRVRITITPGQTNLPQ